MREVWRSRNVIEKHLQVGEREDSSALSANCIWAAMAMNAKEFWEIHGQSMGNFASRFAE
jgi:hypothetical protein